MISLTITACDTRLQEGFASEVEGKYRWITRIYFLMFYIIMLVGALNYNIEEKDWKYP